MTLPCMTPGRASPLGATYDGAGVNFAVFSAHATKITVCLFTEDGSRERHRLDLEQRDGDIWYGYVAGLAPGQHYGLRADGPYAPEYGHRFNVNKLLLDPYARQLTGHPVWDDALMGYAVGDRDGDLSFDVRDSAPFMPRCVVDDPKPFDHGATPPLRTPMTDTVIYEAHVKGLTQTMPGVTDAGTFAGLASEPVLEHLSSLGVTAIELLPAQAFINDRFLVQKGLVNYWGYQTIGFFAPEPRYLSIGQIADFQQMVRRFHAAGIEVLMDVVYNHSGESDELGPTLSFRGLDNASYYRLAEGGRGYINDTGTGNTLNVQHPMVRQMILDSLRYWVEVMGVDGFRFDLCATLGRTDSGFDPGAAIFKAIGRDPVLSEVKLIAEPWDIGPGGYQLGAFPPLFSEWNDKYRDGVRRFWRGDAGEAPALAAYITGSAAQFDHSGRAATSSINLLTAHDGFTLGDVVSYVGRHNHANGEDNRDGHGENYSDNMGVEGPTTDPDIIAARARRRRAMMATLLVSQGTPMILGGDEIGNSQSGNNNAYAQDNETGWVNWADLDTEFLHFARRLVALRQDLPVLRQDRFLHGQPSADGVRDLIWRREDASEMTDGDWHDGDRKLLIAEVRMAAGQSRPTPDAHAALLVFNSGTKAQIILPDVEDDKQWWRRLDSGLATFDEIALNGTVTVGPSSVLVCELK